MYATVHYGGGGGGGRDFFLLLSICTLLASVLLPCMEMVYMYTQLYIRSFYNTIHEYNELHVHVHECIMYILYFHSSRP